MSRIAGFVYGIASAIIGFGSMVYLAGFLANILVPKSIDSGSPGSFGTALLVNVALLGLFGLQHSGMARRGFKDGLTRYVPDLLVRSTYILASGVTLGVLFWLWRPMPSTVWSVEGTVGRVLLWGLFGGGWLLVGVSSELIDSPRLNGLRQAYAYLRGEEVAAPEFQTPGLYRYVRHPLMLGFLIAFWATPHMTVGHLVFALVMTVYIYVGILFEERALVRHFGDTYRAYRRDTPMLVPAPAAVKRQMEEALQGSASNPRETQSSH